MPDLTYPVQLHEHLPNIPELVAHKMLSEMTDIVMGDAIRHMSVNEAEVRAAETIIRWYNRTEDELCWIQDHGMAYFVSGHTTPKILATLYGLKAKGILEVAI